jgi:hypothetical protein
MRIASFCFISLLFGIALVAPVASAKEGVVATVLTPISPTAAEGSQIEVSWSLVVEKTGEPFSAHDVFVRLIGPSGSSTEAFSSQSQRSSDGHYTATATVPAGGIVKIEIGVAGTTTDADGHSKRSDWLMPLANDPITTQATVALGGSVRNSMCEPDHQSVTTNRSSKCIANCALA